MTKEFSKFFIANLKRTAQIVNEEETSVAVEKEELPFMTEGVINPSNEI